MKKLFSRVLVPVRYASVYSSFLASLLEKIEFNRVTALISASGWPLDHLVTADEIRTFLSSQSCASGECHIIGSGMTSIRSVKEIPKESVVIGMNFACLHQLPFHLYFFELCNFQSPLHSSLSRLFSAATTDAKLGMLVAKNIWEGKLDLHSSRKLLGETPRLCLEIYAPYRRSRFLPSSTRLFAGLLLRSNSEYFKQSDSTVISAIVLALQAGFTKVVVHGLDMSGLHFFHSPEIHWPSAALRGDIDALLECTSRPSYAASFPAMGQLLVEIKKAAADMGATLVSADSRAMAAKYIGH